MLVGLERLRQLEQVYKERLTDNSQVIKAARLAAREAALLLMAEDILPSMKEALVNLCRAKCVTSPAAIDQKNSQLFTFVIKA